MGDRAQHSVYAAHRRAWLAADRRFSSAAAVQLLGASPATVMRLCPLAHDKDAQRQERRLMEMAKLGRPPALGSIRIESRVISLYIAPSF
jgi:hypothetical protein